MGDQRGEGDRPTSLPRASTYPGRRLGREGYVRTVASAAGQGTHASGRTVGVSLTNSQGPSRSTNPKHPRQIRWRTRQRSEPANDSAVSTAPFPRRNGGLPGGLRRPRRPPANGLRRDERVRKLLPGGFQDGLGTVSGDERTDSHPVVRSPPVHVDREGVYVAKRTGLLRLRNGIPPLNGGAQGAIRRRFFGKKADLDPKYPGRISTIFCSGCWPCRRFTGWLRAHTGKNERKSYGSAPSPEGFAQTGHTLTMWSRGM